MKTLHRLGVTFLLSTGASLFAQSAQVSTAPAPSDPIDQLVSPIALYPDPLVAVILPASTDWPDLTAANQLVQSTSDPNVIAQQPWDESVKDLAHYPQVVQWMNSNPDWTQQLGATFATQPADVMNAIQQLRATARADGVLATTPQQQVFVQDNVIYIEPAQPNMIYVPSYDPQFFFSADWRRNPRGVLSFSAGFAAGSWLSYNFDWRQRSIFIDRQNAQAGRDWRAFALSPAPGAQRQVWRPRTENVTRARAFVRTNNQAPRPAPFAEQQRNAPAPRQAYQAAPRTPAATPASREGYSVAPRGEVTPASRQAYQPAPRPQPALTPTGRTSGNRFEQPAAQPAAAPAQSAPAVERERAATRPAPQSYSRPAEAARPEARPAAPRAEEKAQNSNDNRHDDKKRNDDGHDGRDDGR